MLSFMRTELEYRQVRASLAVSRKRRRTLFDAISDLDDSFIGIFLCAFQRAERKTDIL